TGRSRRPAVSERVQGPIIENRRVVSPAPVTPSVRPERQASPPASSPPVVRHPSGQTILPPERVRRTRPEELKNERPVIRDRGASVFKPATPENLPVRRMREPRVIIRKPAPQQSGVQPQQPVKKKDEEKRERRER
ncbi:MAG TPA: hypothetical protein VLG39_06785, partial [Nitrospirota bacterium]|nr:hypothetical protein [Nitrospirota bacterium]